MNWRQTDIKEIQLQESQCIGFAIESEDYFIVRHQGQIHAFVNRCPHRGVSLEWQENTFLNFDKNLIQCASHGALFTIADGLCVAGPCQGQSLTKVNHKIVNDQVLIEL